ncbi:MAG TPA: ABC transporter ATP-binding protein [Geminicoccaceae bacterium]|nr:ABC transporter ATP-binding protein [Geminicoccaceae bacterium]
MAIALSHQTRPDQSSPPAPLLAVDRLSTRFATPEGEVAAVSEVSFAIAPGESLGVVGESGSGKTQLFLSIMGLLAKNGSCTGSARLRGQELLGLPARQLNGIRGVRIAMIFQDPMTSLNPYLRISRQMTEVLVEHKGMSEQEARRRSIALLEQVGIPAARSRFDLYPHEFSGGMRQRVMIAIALLCEPALLIADEPTTALDVTVQAQILELLLQLKRDLGMAIVLITHDLGVVAGLSERVMVMYAGRIVEEGPVDAIFAAPQHPYTLGLLRSTPRLEEHVETLRVIPGQPPNLQALPPGCSFHDRCPFVFERCLAERPPLRGFAPGRTKACHLDALPPGAQ